MHVLQRLLLRRRGSRRHLIRSPITTQRRVALHPSFQDPTNGHIPLDVHTPNGLAVDKINTVLYVTDGPDSAVFGEPYNASSISSSSPGIYAFGLGGEDGCMPINKRRVGIAPQGFANGFKVNDNGRIRTAEYEDVVVRNSKGKVLDLFNAVYVLEDANVTDVAPIANFALVGDQLIWLGFDKIYSIQLGQIVKTWY